MRVRTDPSEQEVTMSPRLTILLPLKGRPLFTLRFLWHANAARLPYRFLIADGKVEPPIAQLLARANEVFPNLDIDYVRYPDDTGFPRYYAKMFDALKRVQTPFVMLADNDDFLVESGIDRSLHFLDENPDYVCCGGGIGGFSVYVQRGEAHEGVVGPFNQFSFRYETEDRSQDIGFDSIAERMVAGNQYSWGYYAVYRTAVLVDIWREVIDINFTDLMLHEWFCGLRTLTFGKAYSDASTIGYMRQYWTSLRSSFPKDWVHHLLRSRFNAEFSLMLERLSASAARADNADKEIIAEQLRATFEAWYRKFLRFNYGPLGMLRGLLREKTPRFLAWLKRRRRYSVRSERRTLFKQLASHGASAAYLDQFRHELSVIESVLTGPEFLQFLQTQRAPSEGSPIHSNTKINAHAGP
jgi:glycosyltransferase domain-containing protein